MQENKEVEEKSRYRKLRDWLIKWRNNVQDFLSSKSSRNETLCAGSNVNETSMNGTAHNYELSYKIYLRNGDSRDSKIGNLILTGRVAGFPTVEGGEVETPLPRPAIPRLFSSQPGEAEAVQAHSLPRQMRRASPSVASSSSQVSYFADAVPCELPSANVRRRSSQFRRGSTSSRRKTIPDRPQSNMNLWGILKNCIGKDLTRMPLPVQFCEPLSMLQRLVENLHYSSVLDEAAEISDPLKQMAYVAAFSVSQYGATGERTLKPFNPLLWETFECDRTADLGWRVIAEQVSHHPPISALHAEGKAWTYWLEMSLETRFKGRSIDVMPIGVNHLVFKDGNHYSWGKVKTTVYNVIVGKLWIDNHGECVITNHKEHVKCKLTFSPYTYFGKGQQHEVTGVIEDDESNVVYRVRGHWDDFFEFSGEKEKWTRLWTKKPLPNGSERRYFMSELSCQLNEPEYGVAPTDTRLRPDIRLMEEGRFEEANKVKGMLEARQRERKKEEDRANYSCPYPRPAWFERSFEPETSTEMYLYTGEYWDCKRKQAWDRCPEIYYIYRKSNYASSVTSSVMSSPSYID